jgi:hypothetical protein
MKFAAFGEPVVMGGFYKYQLFMSKFHYTLVFHSMQRTYRYALVPIGPTFSRTVLVLPTHIWSVWIRCDTQKTAVNEKIFSLFESDNRMLYKCCKLHGKRSFLSLWSKINLTIVHGSLFLIYNDKVDACISVISS